MLTDFGAPRFRAADLFYVVMIGVIGAMLVAGRRLGLRRRSCR